jgi:hypothetical protein
MPDLVANSRESRGRRFEVVTVSADEPDRREDVLALLRRKEAAMTNYLFAGRRGALNAALDPTWSAGLPLTLLVAPGRRHPPEERTDD